MGVSEPVCGAVVRVPVRLGQLTVGYELACSRPPGHEEEDRVSRWPIGIPGVAKGGFTVPRIRPGAPVHSAWTGSNLYEWTDPEPEDVDAE